MALKIKDRKPLTYFTNRIDFNKVTLEIENSELAKKHFSDLNWRTIREGVYAACESWLVRDAYEFYIEGIEENIKYHPEELKDFPGCKAIIDLRVSLKGTQAPFNAYPGQTAILDWKTTSGSLSSDWRSRLIDSWQWPIYTAATAATLFIYRGISWTDYDTKEIIIKTPSCNSVETVEYLKGVLSQRRSLVESNLEVWPRSKPKACNAFGRECDFYADCCNYSMPRGNVTERVLSYSRVEDFLLCPERARRGELLEIEGVQSFKWEAEMGSAFHRGMAEIYKQLKELNLQL